MLRKNMLILKPFLVWIMSIQNQLPILIKRSNYHSKSHFMKMFLVLEKISIFLVLLLIIICILISLMV
jgi:hypothetical protein